MKGEGGGFKNRILKITGNFLENDFCHPLPFSRTDPIYLAAAKLCYSRMPQ